MTAETLDTLRRDMTAAILAADKARADRERLRSDFVWSAIAIANHAADGETPDERRVTRYIVARATYAEAATAAALADERRDRAIAAFVDASNRAKGAEESARIAANMGDERRLQEGR